MKQGNSEVKVLDTKISGDVVLHFTNSSLEIGKVTGRVDWERRKQLMDHHTAVHVVDGHRELLGPHIWQAGSNKGALYARIDVTHHSRINRDLLNDIEDRANEIISSNLLIEKISFNREEADSKFSFDIYQGGPPKHDIIRIIKIGNFDIQACGGTHHDNLGEIGEVRIVRTSQVQDGGRASANRGRRDGARICTDAGTNFE